MNFIIGENALTAKWGNETLQISAWGKNALRVRATVFPAFTGEDRALQKPETAKAVVERISDGARITNGKITAFVHNNGWLAFYRGDRLLLKEYYRDFSFANPHSPSMKLRAREFKPFMGGGGMLTVRFEAQPQEKIFGMGQYQQPNFNLKGCVLELAQRNSQISVPFYLSNLGYGFLWNLSGVGEVTFGENLTQWRAACADEMDYWITADDTPKEILFNYTQVVGRAPHFPDSALGLWQSKLRYRTQEAPCHETLFKNRHAGGERKRFSRHSPDLLRFPEDGECWNIADEYFLGSRYLVAPVLYEGMREREVYLPKGTWRHIFSDRKYAAGHHTVPAPLDEIPVFERIIG